MFFWDKEDRDYGAFERYFNGGGDDSDDSIDWIGMIDDTEEIRDLKRANNPFYETSEDYGDEERKSEEYGEEEEQEEEHEEEQEEEQEEE
jgi:hypothetical protein